MVEELVACLPQDSSACVALLRMATGWQAVGKPNQAIDAYFQLISRFPKSAASRIAADKLGDLAREFEQHGCFRLALSLYQKLDGIA